MVVCTIFVLLCVDVCFSCAEKLDHESMASGTASDVEGSTGSLSVQQKWASWMDTDKQTAKEPTTRDGASDFVSVEAKRPGSAKLWSHSVGSIAPHSIKFFCGNPSVEKTEGIIHLYREE